MHVQVVTFGLKGISEERYHEGCKGETGAFADLPGLLSKIWLRNTETGSYGAVYLWRDKESYQSYLAGEIFKSIQQDPTLTEVRSHDFEVYDDLTKKTQPGLGIVRG